MTIERIETNLPDLLQGVESLLRPRAEDKGLELSLQLDTPIPVKVLSDPTRLRQVLMNLIGNAIKFTDLGSVKLRIGIEHEDQKTLLRVAVIDTGSGLMQEQAVQLFKAFSQADSSVTRKHGGTGLGLVLCQRLTGLMGGNVALTNTEPGRGSTFTATFCVEPLPGVATVTALSHVPTEPLTPAPDEVQQHSSLTGRILLAEDGPDNQRLIGFLLKRAGADVDIAENGKIAWQMLEQADAECRPYDLLLTDIQMPEMDGYTLTRRLRDQGSTMAIVALTAHAMPEDRRRCLEAGCNDYATKPIERISLLATCRRWLSNPTYSCPDSIDDRVSN